MPTYKIVLKLLYIQHHAHSGKLMIVMTLVKITTFIEPLQGGSLY